jgi:hypothetical protein
MQTTIFNPDTEAVKVTVENQFGIYSITATDQGGQLTEFMDLIIRPMLTLIGYQKETIDEYFDC